MKRTLIAMRHAKTEEQQYGQEDYDRQLTERGKNDTTTMAVRLIDLGYKPDVIIASSAARTTQTAQIIAAHMGISASQIQYDKNLYLCSSVDLNKKVQKLAPNISQCLVVAHNPGISEFIFDLQPQAIQQALVTAGLTVLSFEGENWSEIFSSKIQVELVDSPKHHI